MKNIVIFSSLLLSLKIFGEIKNDLQEVKEFEIVNFNAIKTMLKQDDLLEESRRKTREIKRKQTRIEEHKRRSYAFPSREDFWPFFSEYWMIRREKILKWNFRSPHFDLSKSFQIFLNKRKKFSLKFKILLLNTYKITHFALPSSEGEVILLLSLPFIRTLNLSKEEIALLLYEDYLRESQGYFKNFINNKKLINIWGKNLKEISSLKIILKELLILYDEMIFKRGFTFQEQFAVTKKMVSYLGNDLKIYLKLLDKIENLSRSNILYKNYSQIYRTPELQKIWIDPKK